MLRYFSLILIQILRELLIHSYFTFLRIIFLYLITVKCSEIIEKNYTWHLCYVSQIMGYISGK